MTTSFTLDGFGPLPVDRPTDVAALGELIRAADGALYPVGGQTKLGLGTTPTRPGRAVDLRGLNRVVDFPARDMTLTVQTGITVAELQAVAASEKLRLPVDVADADRATLGGILATNVSGARRYGYGTLRDYVIGVSAVNDEGRDFKAGGRVVKNVAGYDLCKLLVGSLGTLGILTQATLKLRPLAENQALIGLGCDDAALPRLLDGLHASQTRPVGIELLDRAAAATVFAHADRPAPDPRWSVLVGFEGNTDAVKWQVQQLIKEQGTSYKMETWFCSTAQPFWHALTAWASPPVASVTFKASLKPSAVADFCRTVANEPNPPALRAHAGNGIVFGRWTEPPAIDVLARWRTLASSVIVQHAPAAWKAGVSVWGPSRPDAWLMRAVKEQYDPNHLFNPGRFVDGI